MREVLESTSCALKKSRFVSINHDNLKNFVMTFVSEKTFHPPLWDKSIHYSSNTNASSVLAYIMVLDTLNFCFWPTSNLQRWEINFEGHTLSGYAAMAVALRIAFEENRYPIHSPEWLSTITCNDLKNILGGEGFLQLMDERASALQELGRITVEKYGGSFENFIASAGNSATVLAKLLASELSSFRDMSSYKGTTVWFLKRAQILPADLAGIFDNKGPGEFNDLDKLTAFADYKVPQVLRHIGIIQYNGLISYSVDSGSLIPSGSEMETEIRAATIQAVEAIKTGLSEKGILITSRNIDQILWDMGQKDEFRKKPYHKTVSIFY